MPERIAGFALISVSLLLVGASCGGGASPETRATETATAREGTWTPHPVDAARTRVAGDPAAEVGEEIAAVFTAEAVLPIATPTPDVDTAIIAVGDVMREEAAVDGTPRP